MWFAHSKQSSPSTWGGGGAGGSPRVRRRKGRGPGLSAAGEEPEHPRNLAPPPHSLRIRLRRRGGRSRGSGGGQTRKLDKKQTKRPQHEANLHLSTGNTTHTHGNFNPSLPPRRTDTQDGDNQTRPFDGRGVMGKLQLGCEESGTQAPPAISALSNISCPVRKGIDLGRSIDSPRPKDKNTRTARESMERARLQEHALKAPGTCTSYLGFLKSFLWCSLSLLPLSRYTCNTDCSVSLLPSHHHRHDHDHHDHHHHHHPRLFVCRCRCGPPCRGWW